MGIRAPYQAVGVRGVKVKGRFIAVGWVLLRGGKGLSEAKQMFAFRMV